jgi:hypothetical protein
MGKKRCRDFASLALLISGLASGCDYGFGEPAPVQGHVAYQGVLLRTGTVVFAPDMKHGNTGALARADIQFDGSYALQTEGREGVRPGWYRVTIAALERPADDAGMPISLLPDKYTDPETSGLACEIKPGQENHIEFNLE